jgi:hypothetical protein
MTPSLTVCIPCYKYHIPHLKRCLDGIEAQTVKPTAVIVSCSSSKHADWDAVFSGTCYTFPLHILLVEERKNAAENRNAAAAVATTDLLSFFDADDWMHPRRIEVLLTGFQLYPETDILLHSYMTPPETHLPFDVFETPTLVPNTLKRAPSGCAIDGTNPGARIHHAQCTVKRSIWSTVKFREAPQFCRREDALFCGDVLTRPGIQTLYCSNSLSKYFEEGRTHA